MPNEKILLVDDEDANLRLLTQWLIPLGYDVELASNGEEAVQKAGESRPDLIILDIMMPVMDGYEACRIIKADPKTNIIPIIMVTALNDRESKLKGLSVFANDFLSKPIDQSELTMRVRNLLKIKAFDDFMLKQAEILEEKVCARTIELSDVNGHLKLELARRKAAQDQILQQEKMATIGQLAAGMAHEINNPVGFIMSNLGTLNKYVGRLTEFMAIQTKALDTVSKGESGMESVLSDVAEARRSMKINHILKDLEGLVRESLDGADRMKSIVQDLKSFSRVDKKELRPADINKGLDSTINIVWSELKYKATLKKQYGDLPLIRCNQGQLNQVFMNLLVNAAQAIEKQGEIEVITRHEGDHVYITISDTGDGIPEDKIGRIFEPFFTTKEVGKGTGLGLSIACDIVNKHKGEIMVQSTVGKGTSFTIKIPVDETSGEWINE